MCLEKYTEPRAIIGDYLEFMTSANMPIVMAKHSGCLRNPCCNASPLLCDAISWSSSFNCSFAPGLHIHIFVICTFKKVTTLLVISSKTQKIIPSAPTKLRTALPCRWQRNNSIITRCGRITRFYRFRKPF